ncbi:hypothetical protein F5884DRAFT_857897 [Xylogone sp. PMI_703]|nr:hypothetical protein F5884DRAFT_857897 [Xylogone sp. PMI_703]
MGLLFFNSWALWEKMTFVLAIAILLVFLAGFVKLGWQNRLLKKKQKEAEEKRTKIESMRRKGRFISKQKNHGIPFGVRALQKGIFVEGIWAPMEADLKRSSLEYGRHQSLVEPSRSSKGVNVGDAAIAPVQHMQRNSRSSWSDEVDVTELSNREYPFSHPRSQRFHGSSLPPSFFPTRA